MRKLLGAFAGAALALGAISPALAEEGSENPAPQTEENFSGESFRFGLLLEGPVIVCAARDYADEIGRSFRNRPLGREWKYIFRTFYQFGRCDVVDPNVPRRAVLIISTTDESIIPVLDVSLLFKVRFAYMPVGQRGLIEQILLPSASSIVKEARRTSPLEVECDWCAWAENEIEKIPFEADRSLFLWDQRHPAGDAGS